MKTRPQTSGPWPPTAALTVRPTRPVIKVFRAFVRVEPRDPDVRRRDCCFFATVATTLTAAPSATGFWHVRPPSRAGGAPFRLVRAPATARRPARRGDLDGQAAPTPGAVAGRVEETAAPAV